MDATVFVRAEREETTTTTPDQQVEAARQWFASPRFAGIVRLYSPRQVAEQQGTIPGDYAVARRAAEEFYARLQELFGWLDTPRIASGRVAVKVELLGPNYRPVQVTSTTTPSSGAR